MIKSTLISLAASLAALAFILLPPLPSDASACNQTLTDVNDSSIVCVVNSRNISRFNFSQAGGTNFHQNVRLRTGHNTVVAGDDVFNASITSGNISFTQNITSHLNIMNLTIN